LTNPALSAIWTGVSKKYVSVVSAAVFSKYCQQAEASRAISLIWVSVVVVRAYQAELERPGGL
jgi:hypothetical protein